MLDVYSLSRYNFRMALGQVAAEAVRDAMRARRVPQVAVAERLGIGQTAVSRRLRGEVALTLDELEAVAELLDVEPTDLLGGAA